MGNSFHMKVDNKDENNLNLCGRCHLPNRKTATCTEYGDNCCPRCLAWDHWEDTCWTQDSPAHVCATCNYEGHAGSSYHRKIHPKTCLCGYIGLGTLPRLVLQQ